MKIKVSPLITSAALTAHGITIKKLPYMPLFDRVLVMQIPEQEGNEGKFGDTMIHMPDSIKASTERAACRGILMAAAGRALDHLRSHGAEVGDTVWFSKFSPWRHVVGYKDGKEIELMFLRSADLAGSEEALERLEKGEMHMVYDTELQEHVWVRGDLQMKRHDTAVDEY